MSQATIKKPRKPSAIKSSPTEVKSTEKQEF